ncbi:MAG: hypothetical protein ACK5PP_12015 [Acidimicrobiales bacterium]
MFEINRPGDWVRLMGVPGQRAARTSIRSHLVPDWRSVAERYDGVHLTWAGLITAEGRISDPGQEDVAMLRYWFSERTLWLSDVGPPGPLAPPHLLDDTLSDGSPATVGAPDRDTRRKRDLAVLAGLLDRPVDSQA